MVNKNRLFFFCLLFISIFMSVFIIFIYDKKYRKIDLYFIDSKTGKLEIKSEKIPKDISKIDQIKSILNELISGPSDVKYEPVFSPDVVVQFIALGTKDIVFLSFNWKFIESLYKNPLIKIEALVKTIIDNVRGIKGIKILVDGVEPISNFGSLKLSQLFNYDSIHILEQKQF